MTKMQLKLPRRSSKTKVNTKIGGRVVAEFLNRKHNDDNDDDERESNRPSSAIEKCLKSVYCIKDQNLTRTGRLHARLKKAELARIEVGKKCLEFE